MADQSMDFKYRVSGDRKVAASLRSIESGLDSLGRKMDSTSRAAATAGRNVDGFGSKVSRAVSLMQRVATSAASAVSTAGRGIASTAAAVTRTSAGLARDAALTGAAVSGLASALGGKLANDVAKADQAFTSLELSFQKATGSAAGARGEIDYLTKLSQDMGVTFTDVAGPLAGMENAFVGVGGSIALARENFLGIVQAGQTLGTTSEGIAGALQAIQQVASKGTVSLEEISGQLGERIPGALAIAAKSMNMTTGEFIKLVSTGQLQALPFLEKFGKTLQAEFGESAKAAADDFGSAKSRLLNSIGALKVGIARAGVTDALKRLFDALAKLITAFNKSAAGDIGAGLAKRIDSITRAITEGGRRAIAGYALLSKGPQAYRQALIDLNDDGRSTVATLGKFTTIAPALAFMDGQRYSGFASILLKIKSIAINMFEALRSGSRAAGIAFTGFMNGFFNGNAVKGVGDSFQALSERLRGLARRFEEFAKTGAFETLGKKARYAFNFVTSYTRALFTDTRVVVGDTLRYLYSKLPFGVRQMASAMAGAFKSVINLAKALAPIFQPVVVELKKFFGVADVGMGMFKTRAEKLASPFLILSIIINRNLANGKIGKFAENGKKKMEKLIATVKKTVAIIKLLFNPSKKNDAAILKLAPKMGQVLLDFRAVLIFVYNKIIETYKAVKMFWESWGPAIKRVIGFITGLLDKIAPLFGLKNGKQVLLLLVFLQLVGILPIIIGLLAFVAKAVAFAFFLSSLTTIVSLLGGVASGTITWQVALTQISKLFKGLILGKIFGLWYTAYQAVVNLFLFSKGTIVAVMNTIRGTAIAVFQSIRTLSFGPIITGLKNFGAEAVRLFRVIDAAFGGFISKIFNVIFKGTGGVLKAIFSGFWSLVVRIGALIASSFAAAPVLTVLAIAAIVVLIIAAAYKFRAQIEKFFQSISDYLYKGVQFLFGTRFADAAAFAVNLITAPFREGWRLLMETIDSIFEVGFTGTLKRIGNKIYGWGAKIGNFIKGLFGFKTTVEVKTESTGGGDAAGKPGAGAPGFATGGRVRGKGGPRTDSILAWLSNGEYVINAAAAKLFGPVLDAINYGGSRVRNAFSGGLPKFADGGRVRMPAGGIQPLRDSMGGGGGDFRPFNAFFGGNAFGAQLYTKADTPEEILHQAVRQATRGKVRRGPAAATR